jgi:uncharacterized protein YjiS (DUF1127 family)
MNMTTFKEKLAQRVTNWTRRRIDRRAIALLNDHMRADIGLPPLRCRRRGSESVLFPYLDI